VEIVVFIFGSLSQVEEGPIYTSFFLPFIVGLSGGDHKVLIPASVSSTF